ncbi:MAG: FG-GAP-like repeat-containing protein, partial [Desulfuromonadales bacterium]|nr:FG-GAP-like repeat-containing protein [Desulfuromonadales bacterium]
GKNPDPPLSNQAPEAVTALLEPVNGSQVATATPALTFANAVDPDGDALSYRVIVRQGDAVVYETTVAGQAGATTRVTVGVELTENASFSWTVQAFDAELSSEESAPATFVVNAVDEAPGTPALLTPAEDAVIDGLAVLAWSAVSDPDPSDFVSGYRVDLATDATFSESLVSVTVDTTELALSDLMSEEPLTDAQGYVWRVTALDADQTASEPAVGAFVYDTTVVTVTANVPGAQVFLGGNYAHAGRFVGETPLELRDLSAGVKSLVVRRAGFEPYVTTLELVERGSASHHAVLVPAKQTDRLRVQNRGVNGQAGLYVAGAAVPFVVDFDGDDVLDLLVGDAAGQLWLFPQLRESGRNKVEFAAGTTLALPSLSSAVPFVVDWNNDDRQDLLVGQADGSVRLFINQGLNEAPVFGAGIVLSAGLAPLNVGSLAAPAVLDLNGDGQKDLLVGNGDGAVVQFVNSGSDAAPQFGEGVELLQVAGAAVPLPIDWDADGSDEILVSAGGLSTVYGRQSDGRYLPVATIADDKTSLHAIFPVDIDGGKGKEAFAVDTQGQLHLLVGVADTYVAAFNAALQAKVDELAGLVAEEAPLELATMATLADLIATESYVAAAGVVSDLQARLPVGAAQQSAVELAELCGGLQVVSGAAPLDASTPVDEPVTPVDEPVTPVDEPVFAAEPETAPETVAPTSDSRSRGRK